MGRLTVELTFDVDGDEKRAAEVFRHRENYQSFWGQIGVPSDRLTPGTASYGAALVEIKVKPTREHEGFTNYETFLLFMHYSNHSDRYAWASQWARSLLAAERGGSLNDGASAMTALADRLEKDVERLIPIDSRELQARSDAARLEISLLRAALGRVNWDEIAQVFINRVNES